MAKRRKAIQYKTYTCSLSGQTYKLTAEAKNPEDLVSVRAYYELNPEEDDRPEHIKKKLGSVEQEMAELEAERNAEENQEETDSNQ